MGRLRKRIEELTAHHNHHPKQRLTVSLETALFVFFIIFMVAFAIYESARYFHIEAKIERIRAEHRADIDRLEARIVEARTLSREVITDVRTELRDARMEFRAEIRSDIVRINDRVFAPQSMFLRAPRPEDENEATP